jgi:hypothetical protein
MRHRDQYQRQRRGLAPAGDPRRQRQRGVHATRRQIFANSLGNNWRGFVPVFLTLVTAIVIPLAVFWWKSRNRPGGPGSTPDQTPPNDGWL